MIAVERAYQFDSLLCRFFSAVSDKGIASVEATERIHHQAQVPDGASFLKQRNQLILKQVSGNLPYEYLSEHTRIVVSFKNAMNRWSLDAICGQASIQLLAVNHHCNLGYYRRQQSIHHLDTKHF